MEKRINWIDSPDESEIRRNFQLRRAPKGGRKLQCAILSNRLLWVRTHWIGRTQPCTSPNCTQCDLGQIPELKAYVIAVLASTKEKFILELSAGGARPLKDHQDTKGLVHGLAITVGRKNDRDNGPVHTTIDKTDVGLLMYGEAPDLRPILETMWRFDSNSKALADSKRARRENELGEQQTPASGPIASENPQVSKVKGKPRKRS